MATSTTIRRPRVSQKQAVSTAGKKPTGRKPVVPKASATKTPARKAVPRKAPLVPMEKPEVTNGKPSGQPKVKFTRLDLSLPKRELTLLRDLKKRAQKLGLEFKKSEILRAGLAHLLAMTDATLRTTLAKVERVEKKVTGKAKKKRGKR